MRSTRAHTLEPTCSSSLVPPPAPHTPFPLSRLRQLKEEREARKAASAAQGGGSQDEEEGESRRGWWGRLWGRKGGEGDDGDVGLEELGEDMDKDGDSEGPKVGWFPCAMSDVCMLYCGGHASGCRLHCLRGIDVLFDSLDSLRFGSPVHG